VGDGDDLAIAVVVGVRAADGDQQAGRLVLDVGQVEGDELGTAHRGRGPRSRWPSIAPTR
jgi:hypothetical protein